MSRESRIVEFAQAVGAEIKAVREENTLTLVSGAVTLPTVPTGQMLGYRVSAGGAMFTAPNSSTVVLDPGLYVLENSVNGWLVHQLPEGRSFATYDTIVFDTFTATNGTAINGRTVGAFQWVDNPSADVYGSGGSTRVNSTITNNRVHSVTNSRTQGQILIGEGPVRISMRFYHSGENPGSGTRATRMALSDNYLGAAFGATTRNALYVFYEGGTGFRSTAINGSGFTDLSPAYTGLGTGAIEANMTLEYDGDASMKYFVNGTQQGALTKPMTGLKVASWEMGRFASWWIDDFKVDRL